jgi:NADH:ubiquinone oxidoreductase subunit 4 (subunit M)
MRPVEILTLAPLATLTVILGVYPALILDLIAGPVRAVLAAVDPSLATAIGR